MDESFVRCRDLDWKHVSGKLRKNKFISNISCSIHSTASHCFVSFVIRCFSIFPCRERRSGSSGLEALGSETLGAKVAGFKGAGQPREVLASKASAAAIFGSGKGTHGAILRRVVRFPHIG